MRDLLPLYRLISFAILGSMRKCQISDRLRQLPSSAMLPAARCHSPIWKRLKKCAGNRRQHPRVYPLVPLRHHKPLKITCRLCRPLSPPSYQKHHSSYSVSVFLLRNASDSDDSPRKIPNFFRSHRVSLNDTLFVRANESLAVF